MADNKQLPATGTGTADIIVATDQIGGVDYQRVKAVWGADGSANDTSAANPMPVVQTGALPAGSAAIGKLAANSGVDIGDVDVTSITPGTTATALGKAEDAAHTTGDVGVMALGVQQTTLAALAANGDYVPAQMDALGAQYVVSEERLFTITVSPTVTNGAYSAGDVVGGLLTFANAARISGGAIVVESLVIMCKTPALANSLELWLWDRTFTNVADNGAVSYSDADAANCIGVIACGAFVDNALNSISTRMGIGLAAVLNGTDLFGQLVTRNGPTLTSTSDIQVKLTVRQG